MMARIKFWLFVLSIILIMLDKYSYISNVRDYVAVTLQKQTNSILYKINNYPKLVLLQRTEQQKLEDENINLKKQVQRYAILLKQQNNWNIEHSAINELESNGQLYSSFKVQIARAVIDVNYLMNNRLLIDKGTKNGISVGDAVVNKEGVVGQVINVNDFNAQVLLLTNQDYKVYLQTAVTKSKMLAQGITNNQLLVRYINKNEKIKVGDTLYTTGLDDLYPANIPVAKVDKIFYENNGFNSAICTPVINFNNLGYVLVLKHAN